MLLEKLNQNFDFKLTESWEFLTGKVTAKLKRKKEKINAEMLRVERTVYFQICRQIKAKTPFAPVFFDISKLLAAILRVILHVYATLEIGLSG